MILKANKKTVSANFKYPHDQFHLETNIGYTSKQNLPNASYTLTKELNQKQFVIKHILNVAGEADHPKKKRNSSLKLDFKNMKQIHGNIALTYDWSTNSNDFLSLQSSLCTNLLNPWFMGISSTSKIYKPKTSSLSSVSTTNSAFIRYKSSKFISAVSCNPSRQEIEVIHLQKAFMKQKNTKLAVKLKYSHQKKSADVNAVIQHKLNKRGDVVRVKANNEGNVALAVIASRKKTNLSFAVFSNYPKNTFSWALSYKIKI